MSDWKARIESALKRRDTLSSQKDRAMGRLEEAEKNVASIRAELQAKKIDPDNLDKTIEQLESALDRSLADFEAQLTDAETKMKPFNEVGGNR